MARLAPVFLRRLLLGLGALLPGLAGAAPVEFNLPAQPAADALVAFSSQADIEVLFSYDELRAVPANAVTGRYEPEQALIRLLKDTAFAARRDRQGKFVVTRVAPPTGSIKGRLLTADGLSARNVRVTLPAVRLAVKTDSRGGFFFAAVPAGTHELLATGPGYRSLQITGVQVAAGRMLTLEAQTMQAADEVTQLEPYVVQGKSDPHGFFNRSRTPLAPKMATGNLDLPRTENGVLPYTVYDRDQIIRSGVVSLNEFLQRAVLESDATHSPEENGSGDTFVASSTNLNLRGYGADQTVVLVNGRRLPEVLTNVKGTMPADVNFIPLSLIQQVEVLPVSASALYSGNAVGGVINIVLRSGADADATEVNTTYNNAPGRFDAPQSSVSLLHGQTLLDGRLRLRLNASFTKATPPVESELGYHQARVQPPVALDEAIYRATPNIRSADGTPLFGPGTSPVTSVAPGADGTGGLAAFVGRQGVRNLDFFDSPGALAASSNSLDYPYGRRQQRSAYFGSVIYDVFPWLQLGVDATYARTVVNRGFDVLTADLTLPAGAPLNPFAQDIVASLNEIAPRLGEDYSEARLEYSSVVLGAMLKLPSDWRVSLDAQYAHNLAKYRGLLGVDADRWQQLVEQGRYNPLRDTQVHGPPQEFYDRVLIYYGGPGRFVTLGNYDTLDGAVRVTNQSLALPAGRGSLNLGADYRRNHLGAYTEQPRFADGSLARDPVQWSGRTLQRYSVFGELQAPLLPVRWLPPWLRSVESDLAVRYIAADTSRETNLAPTLGLKVDFANGLAFRGSFTTSNRVPTPQMSRPVLTGGGGGGGINLVRISDPLRNQSYDVAANDALNPNLLTEAAVTQTAGFLFQGGKTHRYRATLDFVDTRKTNEVIVLEAQDVLNLEALFPERVTRDPLAPGDTHSVGRVSSLLTGAVNVASRHSQNWNASLDYAWTDCLGGTLELYGRWVYFSRYERRVFPASPLVDELGAPDGRVDSLLKHRANFGAGWSNRDYGFGLDGHYYHSRILPALEWPSQGGRQIDPHWQFDAYLQSDLGRWLPWQSSRFSLRGQVRVNNVFDGAFPAYANDGSGAGVQPYGDWRGRIYSLSLTATF
ncbi:MAG TPA: TonB-dependent receptor [Lacunisphaera sp.]|nr:TonB-dependent receptor [Lacunisphaera sp.]